MVEEKKLPEIIIPNVKKTVLTPLEELVAIPANDMSRYKNLPIDESVKAKIFGKLRQHSLEQFLIAGQATYP